MKRMPNDVRQMHFQERLRCPNQYINDDHEGYHV